MKEIKGVVTDPNLGRNGGGERCGRKTIKECTGSNLLTRLGKREINSVTISNRGKAKKEASYQKRKAKITRPFN